SRAARARAPRSRGRPASRAWRARASPSARRRRRCPPSARAWRGGRARPRPRRTRRAPRAGWPKGGSPERRSRSRLAQRPQEELGEPLRPGDPVLAAAEAVALVLAVESLDGPPALLQRGLDLARLLAGHARVAPAVDGE